MYYRLGLGLLLIGFFQNFSAVPWRAAHSEFFVFFAVLIWTWGVVRSRTVQFHLTPPTIILLCVILLIGLQYVSGQLLFGGDAIILLIYAQLCLGALWVGQSYAEDPKWPRALALAILFAAIGSAIIALAQALWVWNEAGWILSTSGYRRPGANLGQPNNLATLLVMGAVSLIYLDQRLKISHLILMLLSFLLLLGMGISESRTGLLSATALSVWLLGRKKAFVVPPRWSWVGVCMVALVTWMWLWPLVITFVHGAGFASDGVGLSTLSATAGTRLRLWEQLWHAIGIKPWLGWGLQGTSIALNAVLDTHAVSEPFTYAHNVILDVAIGIGVPLTLLVIALVGIWGWTRISGVRTPETWFAAGLLIPFGAHSMLEYPFAYAYFLVPVFLAVGMLERSYVSSVLQPIPKKIVAAFGLVFAALLLMVAVEYMRVEEDFRVARFEALNVGQTAADYERPQIVFLTQLRALLEVTRTVPRPNMSNDSLQLLQSAASRFPWVSVQNCYALSAALNGKPRQAQRQLEVIRAMHGEGALKKLRISWEKLASDQYPQLSQLEWPQKSVE